MARTEPCKFCEIVAGDRNAYVFYEDKYTLCMLARHPRVTGQCVIIPKQHCASLYDIPDTELRHVMASVKKVSEMLKEKLGAQGINVLHSSGEAAQQYVQHFAIHLFPRSEADGLDIWPSAAEVVEKEQ